MRDRHVLVTGGAGGLGTTVVATLRARGARITAPVLDAAQAEHLRATLGDDASAVAIPQADLSQEGAVQRVIDEMERVDVAVHLVGGFAMGATESFAVETLRKQLELNVVTAFLVLKHALRRMKQTGYGRIVTVGSQAAAQPPGEMAAYAAAKAAVLAMTRSVAEETRTLDITANCVLPSIIDTPANREAMGKHHVGAWVSPARLAEAIAYLASEAAGDVRGAGLPVYGRV